MLIAWCVPVCVCRLCQELQARFLVRILTLRTNTLPVITKLATLSLVVCFFFQSGQQEEESHYKCPPIVSPD